MQAISYSYTTNFWCEMWWFRVKCGEFKRVMKSEAIRKHQAVITGFLSSNEYPCVCDVIARTRKLPARQFHTDVPFINPCFWTWGASQQIFCHTPLCIFYAILRLVALISSGTAHNTEWSHADINWDLWPAAILRTTLSDLFPYLHSHHYVLFHTTFCYLSNSLRVQPPTQEIVSKFRPGTGYKLCFRFSDVCTGFILVSCGLELYLYF